MEHRFGLSVFKAVLAGVVCLRCHFDATVLSGLIIAYSNPMVVKEHARMNFDRRHVAIDAVLLRRNRAGSSVLLAACRMTRNTLAFIVAVALARRMHVRAVASRTGQMIVRFQIAPGLQQPNRLEPYRAGMVRRDAVARNIFRHAVTLATHADLVERRPVRCKRLVRFSSDSRQSGR